ncbi:hypothetical protein BBAD15_g12478 [Beauveria bassiana D1-5]|uniref:Uncharacterized protein n=1 Tax=Beauveria bassiana D1-5 TaxID=1245745 RepID=A0A0A2V4A6_BEABA|nr:hypothetical protein BBAD15_g12478 [Beauveria bassiana D1-5]
MNKVPAPGTGVQDHPGQPPPPSTLRSPGFFSMTAKHKESAPILKRTYFTPAVPTWTQEPAAAPGGKKRIKLGYHRTSIACNCTFCPVDQPPTVDSQGKPAGPKTGSSTAHSRFSSPALAFRQSVDMTSGSITNIAFCPWINHFSDLGDRNAQNAPVRRLELEQRYISDDTSDIRVLQWRGHEPAAASLRNYFKQITV